MFIVIFVSFARSLVSLGSVIVGFGVRWLTCHVITCTPFFTDHFFRLCCTSKVFPNVLHVWPVLMYSNLLRQMSKNALSVLIFPQTLGCHSCFVCIFVILSRRAPYTVSSIWLSPPLLVMLPMTRWLFVGLWLPVCSPLDHPCSSVHTAA